MTVYNVNIGIGWASSGVEYAQAYRAEVLRAIKQPAKFIFTELILNENIQSLTSNIGFKDDEIIWLYQHFTDMKIAPSSYTLDMLKESVDANNREYTVEKQDNIVRLRFPKEKSFITCYMNKNKKNIVDRAEFVSHGYLIKKDYYSYAKYLTEYYTPRDNKAHVYLRRFYNEDGSVAYEEIVDGDNEPMYRFDDKILYSRAEFLAYFLESLHLKETDALILDRSTDGGGTFFKHVKPAKLGIVVHAEHYSEGSTDDDYILWNNYYEYQFVNGRDVDFFICATDAQKTTLEKQFKHYNGYVPKIVTIPVGSLDKLRDSKKRVPYSLITASRLASEKHIDWIAEAVVKAKKQVPELTFDIYGSGSTRKTIEKIIKDNDAQDYIKLKGHQDLTNVYRHYSAYIAASTSEGFGLTLMEAIGSGLPMIGLDVPYGNQTFISDKENGFLLPYKRTQDVSKTIDLMADAIVKLFNESDIKKMKKKSFEIGKGYLTSEIENKWRTLMEELNVD